METFQKLKEGHKTFRRVVTLIITLVICLSAIYLVWLFNSGGAQKTEVIANFESMRLSKCQEVVIVKGVSKVHATLVQPQVLFGVMLPKFAPGSKSVEFNGPIVTRFGYDSSMLLFPTGTQLIPDGTMFHAHYTIRVPEFQRPKVLSEPSLRGYTHESGSYFTGEIPSNLFFGYIDSLAVVAGNKAVADNTDFFRDAYMKMVCGMLVRLLDGKADFTIIIGNNQYDKSDLNHSEKQPDIIEGIEGTKKL